MGVAKGGVVSAMVVQTDVGARDLELLRRSFDVAAAARARGCHPFGAVLAGPDGMVLMEQGNDHASGDRTAHAERTLMARASQQYDAAFLAGCTMYTSAEPCAMCAGAVYWVGVGRVIYAMSEAELKALIGPHPQNLTMDLPCRVVLGAGQRRVAVAGPLLEHEARAVHEGFW